MSKLLVSWEAWVYGLFAALIGGGAGAIGSGFAQVIIDPAHSDLHHMLVMMGTTFIVSGIVSAAFYLAKSPLPQIVTVDTEKTINTTPDGGVSIKSVSVTKTDAGVQ